MEMLKEGLQAEATERAEPSRKTTIKPAKVRLVLELRDRGWEPSLIASVLGISRASVYRIISKGR